MDLLKNSSNLDFLENFGKDYQDSKREYFKTFLDETIRPPKEFLGDYQTRTFHEILEDL